MLSLYLISHHHERLEMGSRVGRLEREEMSTRCDPVGGAGGGLPRQQRALFLAEVRHVVHRRKSV